MALSSMTGFARSHGVCRSYAWAWEIKSVNGKGLDLRLRLPSGWDAVEPALRARASETLSRGSIQAGLTVERTGVTVAVRATWRGASKRRRPASTACWGSRASWRSGKPKRMATSGAKLKPP
jgi:hypothetical protein